MTQLTDNEKNTWSVTGLPDHCPLCHHKIAPQPRFGQSGGKSALEFVFACPNRECGGLFIAYYVGSSSGVLRLSGTRPTDPVARDFAQSIRDTSPAFCAIYNEAHYAEQLGLMQICGIGYRKALEFLIKDYLAANRPNDATAIKSALLGRCIDQYVTDPRTKEVAKRATWLGNDEAHYERRWIDKDLADLKVLIDLVLHWMQAEQLTAEMLKSMPPP
jgi:hypothetical protein